MSPLQYFDLAFSFLFWLSWWLFHLLLDLKSFIRVFALPIIDSLEFCKRKPLLDSFDHKKLLSSAFLSEGISLSLNLERERELNLEVSFLLCAIVREINE